jgi:acyl carrier protein
MIPTEEQLLHVLQAELGTELHGVTTTTALRDVADSLEWIGLLDAVEAAFGRPISLEQGLGLRCIGDLLRVVAPPVPL